MSNQDKFDEIINSPSPVICIIAGPGSGKTKGILIPKVGKILSKDNSYLDFPIFIRLENLKGYNPKSGDQIGGRAWIQGFLAT